jgi:hypothetical protein
MQTYWLYFYDRALTAVRLPIGATRQECISKAVADHKMIPLNHPESPYMFEKLLKRADVRIFVNE